MAAMIDARKEMKLKRMGKNQKGWGSGSYWAPDLACKLVTVGESDTSISRPLTSCLRHCPTTPTCSRFFCAARLIRGQAQNDRRAQVAERGRGLGLAAHAQRGQQVGA